MKSFAVFGLLLSLGVSLEGQAQVPTDSAAARQP